MWLPYSAWMIAMSAIFTLRVSCLPLSHGRHRVGFVGFPTVFTNGLMLDALDQRPSLLAADAAVTPGSRMNEHEIAYAVCYREHTATLPVRCRHRAFLSASFPSGTLPRVVDCVGTDRLHAPARTRQRGAPLFCFHPAGDGVPERYPRAASFSAENSSRGCGSEAAQPAPLPAPLIWR
jgi:hypothetical protein